MSDFNKYQFTRMWGEFNFTIRSDDFVEFGRMLTEVAPLIEKAKAANPVEEALSKKCEKCGGNMVYKTGVKKETGKKWTGWFCENESCKNVEWGK